MQIRQKQANVGWARPTSIRNAVGRAHPTLILRIAAAFGLIFIASATGQVRIVNGGPMQGAAPDTLTGSENTAGVYVRDSAIALERLANAKRMESLKEWNKSAEFYQEILEKYPDRVVPSGVDSNNKTVQYTSVTETVRQAICKWPQDGLDVYRGMYETTADNLLNSAGSDLNKLHMILNLYFPTESAKTAGIRLMDIYFEQGDYSAVWQLGRQLLDWHPGLGADRAGILYRTALAEHLGGDDAAAQNCQKELHDEFPTAAGTVRGEDVNLADSITKELDGSSHLVVAQASDTWPTFGGDASRSKTTSSRVRPGARIYTIPLATPPVPTTPDPTAQQQLRAQAQADLAARSQGTSMGVMPVEDHGELFFQDNANLYAVSLDSGQPLPGWAATYPGDHGVYQLSTNANPTPAGEQFCVSVDQDHVVAVMGLGNLMSTQEQMMRIQLAGRMRGVPGMNTGSATNTLVCLDRESGRLMWTMSLSQLPEDRTNLRSLEMSGSPLIVGNNVYVTAHGGSTAQEFDDCYVLCFDLNSGQMRWSAYLASSATAGMGTLPDGQIAQTDPVSHIAYSGGRLYIGTNLGAVASVDAFSGAVYWLDIYRDQNQAIDPNNMNAIRALQMGEFQAPATSVMPWTYSSAIVADGKLFIFPADSRNILVYDAGSGKELKRISTTDLLKAAQGNSSAMNDAAMPSTLIGVVDDKIYVAGSTYVWCVPWKSISGSFNSDDPPKGFWITAALDDKDQLRGRPFITADGIYLPTQQCLHRVTLGGVMDVKFPPNGWEPDEEGPGNVIVAQDHVVVAGDLRVAVYTDIAIARGKLDLEMAASPNDPTPRLHYAEVMGAAADWNLAFTRLDEAFDRIAAATADTSVVVRQRAFDDAMTFASRVMTKPGMTEKVRHLYDLAARAASTAQQQVQFRIARAKFERAAKEIGTAIDLYQQILSDPNLRLVLTPDETDGGLLQAAYVAQARIGEMLHDSQGEDAYAKYEQAAQDQMRDALTAKDPIRLSEVAVVYPNSNAAHDALQSAADLYESQSKPRLAIVALRKILNQYPDLDRGPILEAMARNYLRLPNGVDAAISRLSSAASGSRSAQLSKPLALPDGSILNNITLGDARDQLKQFSLNASTARLPDLHFPTHTQKDVYKVMHGGSALPGPFQPDVVIANVEALIPPVKDFERNDRVVTWSHAGGLTVYSPQSATPVFSCADVKDKPLSCAWMEAGLLVWTDKVVFMCDGQSGKVIWSLPISNLPPAPQVAENDKSHPAAASPDPSADDPFLVAQKAQLLAQHQIQVQIINGNAVMVQPNMQQQPDSAAAERGKPEHIMQLIPLTDRIAISTSQGRLASVEAATGNIVWQSRIGNEPIEHLLASEDFVVATFVNSPNYQLRVFNSFTGEMMGRKTFDSDGGEAPLNFALASDGSFAYTTNTALFIQDLNDASLATEKGMDPKFKITPQTNNNGLPTFGATAGPETLLFNGGRVFALADQGQNIRIYSAETGMAWRPPKANGGPGEEAILPTNSRTALVKIQVSGSYFYAVNPKGIVAYHVNNTQDTWPTPGDASSTVNIEQVLYGKDFLIALNRPKPSQSSTNKPGSDVYPDAYSRMVIDATGKESGNLIFAKPELLGIDESTSWQAFDGGICYNTGGSLHILKGMRDTLATTMPTTEPDGSR